MDQRPGLQALLFHSFGKAGSLSYNGRNMTKEALFSKLKYFFWILLFILISLTTGILVFYRG